MLTVAVARSRGAWNISFWTARSYQRAGQGFSASLRADSPVCRLINLIIESSCSTLIRAWWASWEDSLSTVTSLYDFFATLAVEGCPLCSVPCSLLSLCDEIGRDWPHETPPVLLGLSMDFYCLRLSADFCLLRTTLLCCSYCIDHIIDMILFTRQTSAEEGKDCEIGWQGDGNSF